MYKLLIRDKKYLHTFSATLDYETTTDYTLTITASDGGAPSLSSDITLTVAIGNVNDGQCILGFTSPVR